MGLPENGTLVVVTSTYNGSAPDSATKMETAIREKQHRRGRAARPHLRRARRRQHAVEDLPGLPQADRKHAAPDRRQEPAAARRGRRQRRFRRGRRALDGRRCGRRWARATPPAVARRRKLKIAFSDEHATRASVLPESAYRLEVIGNDELVRDATGLWDFSKEAPRSSTRHMTIRLPKDVDLSHRRPPGGLCPQPARGRRQHHRAAGPAAATRSWCSTARAAACGICRSASR